MLPMAQGASASLSDSQVLLASDKDLAMDILNFSGGYFTENRGQFEPSIKFVAITEFGKAIFYQSMVQYSLDVSEDGERIDAQVITLTFPGSGTVSPEGLGLESHCSNYFIGDPSTWVSGARNYHTITYQDLWPGIDLLFLFNDKGLKYEYRVDPYIDEKAIKVEVDGADLWVDSSSLKFDTGDRCLTDGDLLVTEGTPMSSPLEAIYTLSGNRFSYAIKDRDMSQELLIDPLVYSTYMGGSGNDYANSIAVDSNGNSYVAGYTYSSNFPISNPYQAMKGDLSDVFVLKLNAAGNTLLYSTFIGGGGNDAAKAIAIDSSGNVYVTGYTYSTNFPTSNPYKPSNSGSEDAFVLKLDVSGGSLVYSTYIGGSNDDVANGIALDASGYAFVTGNTGSTNFPTLNPYQGSNKGVEDAFVLKLNIAGNALVYSTYIGGSAEDYSNGIDVDFSGNAYVAGGTYSTNFPTSSPYQSSYHGFEDAYLLKLNPNGNALVYSTYVGGSNEDSANAIAVESQGNAYLVGSTSSTDFPTLSPYQPSNGGSEDAFVIKFNAAGSNLVYSTYIGGSGSDSANGVALDSSGIPSVTGRTSSSNFPISSALQPNKAGGVDAFEFKLSYSGGELVYSTYLGGSGGDTAYGIAVDASGNAHICGYTTSSDFPTFNPLQGANGLLSDAFICMIGQPVLSSAVIGLTTSAGEGKVTLNWQAPTSNGGASITKYRIYRGTASGQETYLAFVGNILTYTDHAVTHQAYFYRVSAMNLVGEGPLSAEAGPAIPTTIPGAPTGLTASPGDAQITLTWSAPIDDGGQPITYYNIYRGTEAGGEAFLITVESALTYTNIGLTNGQTYFYLVSAINGVGQGGLSNEVSATPTLAPTAPSAPIGLTATSAYAQINLAWSLPSSNGSSPITGFKVYRGTAPGIETLLTILGNVLSYPDTGLTNGQIYYYRVSAINSIGEGNQSNEASAMPGSIPSAPQDLTAIRGNSEVTLNWAAPSGNGGASITNYKLYRGTTPGGESYFTTLGNLLTYTNTGLINGQTYYYKVSAMNGVGEGSQSNEASATPGAVPSAPTITSATPGNAKSVLSWTVPSNDGGSAVLNYSIYRGTSSGAETFLTKIGNMLTFTDAGLINGQIYFYKVSALNAIGESSLSNEVSVTPATLPSVPLNLTATAGNSKVILTWSAPSSNGGSAITGYKVYQGTASGAETLLMALDNVLTFESTGLINGQAYYYKVSASNAVGEGPRSTETSVVPVTTPSAPTITSATPGNAQIVLTWTAPSSDGGSSITGYRVYRGTAPGGEALLTTCGNVLTFTDNTLTNGHIYYYKLSAVNSAGEGSQSNEASATPVTVPSAPQNLAVSVGNGQLTLSWSIPSSNGGNLVTGYKVYRGLTSGAETYLITLGNVLAYVDTSLVNGQTYYYKVSAVNDFGEGSLSSEASAAPASAPSAPRGLQAIAGDTFVDLNWTAPSYSGPGTLTYHLFRNGALIWSGNGLEHTDGGLTNDVTYTYKVAAQNSIGWGENSSQVQVTPRAIQTAPTSPNGLTAVPGNLLVDINWTAPYYLGPGTIIYHLFRNGSLIWSGIATSYHDAPLSKGVQYSFKVAASNAIGWGSNCTAVLVIPVGVPDAPWGLLPAVGDAQASLTWNQVNYSGPGTLTYHLFRDAGEIWSGTSTFYDDTGLSNGQVYAYKVAASNSIGWSDNSSSAIAMPQGPPTTPRGFMGYAGEGLVALNWTAPSYLGPGALTYHLFRDGTEVWSGTANARIDIGLNNGQTYIYKVAASNSIGWSANTSHASLTPQGPPTPPRGLTAVSSNEAVELNWTAPSYLGPGALTYHLFRDGAEMWSGTSSSHIDASLENGQTYIYKVAASNSIGWSANSSSVIISPQGPPGIPRGLMVKAGNGYVELNWTVPSYSGPGTLIFHLFRDDSLIWSGSVLSQTDNAVTNGLTYSYKVAAQNSIGWGKNCTEVIATPVAADTVPAAPRGLTAIPGVLIVDLNWTEPSYLGPGAITYQLFRDDLMVWSGFTTSYHDVHLSKGVQYSYNVAASNSIGRGANCSSVTATPMGVPDEPWGLRGVPGNAQASLSWNAANYTGPGTLIYHLFRDGAEVWNGPTTYYIDIGLNNGQTYIYKVAASNSIGWSVNSSIISVIPQGPPSAPRGLTAQVGNGFVELNWTAPEYLGPGSLIYHLYRNGVLIWNGSEPRHSDGGLVNFVTYSYEVTAQNAAGWGQNSTIILVTPLPEEMTPSAPRDLVVLAGNENLTLAWEAPAFSNASMVLGYAISFGITPDSLSNLITCNQLTYTVEGLNKGQAFYFQVSAQNDAGWGPNSTLITGTPFGVPSSPSALMVEAGDAYVMLSWSAPSYLGPGTTTYNLFRDGTLIWTGVELDHNDTPLANGITYLYNVAAQNIVGWGANSSALSATPTAIVAPVPPGVPSGFQVVAGDGQTTLTWDSPDQPGSADVSGYKVYRGTSPDELHVLASVTSTTFVDTGLINGQAYYYRVSAVSEAGEGATTDIISATPFSVGGQGGQDLTIVVALVALGAIAAVVLAVVMSRRKKG
jgi:large repetitive protein